MFNDLPDNKAIKMGEVYVVKLASSFYHRFEVNGVRVNAGLHTLPNLDNIFSVKPAVKKLIYYKLGEETIPIADYNVKNPSYYYDSDYEEYGFDSLEHEYEVKKEWERIKGAVPVYDKTFEQLLPVEIEVVGIMVDTGSKFISTPYQYGMAFFDAYSKGIFSIDLGSISLDEVNQIKAEYLDAKITNSNHSHLTFLQVGGKYMYGHGSHEGYITGKGTTRVTTTLQEAKDLEKDIRQKIRSRLMMEIKPVVADSVMIKDIHEDLKSIKRSLIEIDVKQKSYHSKQGLLKRITERMLKLEGFVSE